MLACLKVLVVAVLTATLCAGPAQAAGQLDQGFSQQGRVTLALDLGGRGDAALAPDGSLFVANDQYVAHILPGGWLDPSFGNGGLAAIEAPTRAAFSLADIAVDGSGRPLVFGAAVWPGVEGVPGDLYPAEPPTSAMARRFQPNGAPDPSFSSNGLLVADFGLTSPFTTANGSATGPLPVATIAQARLDRRERIVLAVSETGGGRGVPALARFVVRLGRNGFVDSSFGQDGVAAVAGDASAVGMALDRRGAITLAGSPSFGEELLVITRFRSNGRPDTGLGPRGQRVYVRGGNVGAVAANRAGGIAVLGRAEEGQQRIFRLRPDGEPARGFGDAGLRLLGAKRGIRSLLLDRRGRVLTLGVPRDVGAGSSVQAIERLLPSGSIDRGFGHDGTLLNSFEPSYNEQPWAMLFSGKRLLTVASGQAGPVESGGWRLLLTRYELG